MVFQPRTSRTQNALSHGLLTKDLKKYAFSIKMAVGKNIRLGKIKYVRKILKLEIQSHMPEVAFTFVSGNFNRQFMET